MTRRGGWEKECKQLRCHATGAGGAKSRVVCEKMDRNVNTTYKNTYKDTYKDTYNLPFGRFRLPPRIC